MLKPFAEVQKLLPPLSTYEREQLKNSLIEHGFIQPILCVGDKILDGHHRVEIWREITGEEPPENRIERIDLDDDEAFAVAIKFNLSRRQLSTEQFKEIAKVLREQGKTQEETADILGVDNSTISIWENKNISNLNIQNAYTPPDLRVSIPSQEYDTIYDRVKKGELQRQVASDYKVTQPRISQVVRLVKAREEIPEPTETPEFPDRWYHCLVIDPPWPMKKIEREVAPNQGLYLDYPTMTLDQISEIPIPELAHEEGCHVFLWVTQKYLPEGLSLFENWGVKYQCLLTWVKPGGFTPFSWMYNTEHVLFGRIGSLDLLKLGVKLSFEEAPREHSRKPEVFYDIVRKVSPNPRLELFAREIREGFETWGNETTKFEETKQ